MLNKVLHIDLLLLFHSLTHNISRERENNKCLSSIRAYRAQFMLKEEIEILENATEEFILINSFLSISTYA